MVMQMRFYMFGMDGERPGECARELKAKGVSVVVSPPDEKAAQALRDEGLDIWGCIGAFSMKDSDPEDWLSEDAFGEKRRWFGSGCPNERALWERGFDQISRWKSMGAKAVLADGARFASPCPGTELFLSCFCPRCMEKGAQMGYDMEKMRESVQKWAKTPGMTLPEEWLRFREECTAAYFSEFARRVRAEGMECGSFVFAPSLGNSVGQTEKSTRGLDIIAPMLYRKYLPRPGIATLNDEYASLWRFYEARGDADIAEQIEAECGTGMPGKNADGIWQNGFAPEAIGTETAQAKAGYGGLTAPILQLDDDRLAQTIGSAAAAGADAIGFFMYNEEGMRKMPGLAEYHEGQEG